ncbi:hypothetical protein EDB80DRAFT_691007 [Ilyonectria destructans]|nr:hypothetical protein EDB80DRAFT_691007 [Ilyonectria destructans]
MVLSSSLNQHLFSHFGDASTREELHHHNSELLFTHSSSRPLKLIGEFDPNLCVCPPLSSYFPVSNATKLAGIVNAATARPVTATVAVGRHGIEAGCNVLHEEPIISARSPGRILPNLNSTSFSGIYPSMNNLVAPVRNNTNIQSTNAVAEVDSKGNADPLVLFLLKLYLRMRRTSQCGRAPDFRWNSQGMAASNCEEHCGRGCVDGHWSVQCGTRSDLDAVWWKH